MLNRKALLPSLFAVIILYSCGTSAPASKNVLAKPSTPSAPVTAPEQTVFTKPEQKTANNTQQRPATQQRPVQTPVFRPNGPRPAAKTPAYYRYLADSMQMYARANYQLYTDSLMKVMTETPLNARKRNPAINAGEWYSAVNFNIRKPNYVILHHTAQTSADQTLFTFSVPWSQTSAHYVVGRDGVVHQMLNDYMRAWHAGKSKWGSITDMNSCSIGIEIDNSGSEPFSEAQVGALIRLLDYLKDTYDIPQANFVGHSDIAPGRKSDPSSYFPWKRLASAGFGYWYDEFNMKTPPEDFNALLALKVIGYDISSPAKAIGAFKLHYIQNDKSSTLNDYDKKVLYNLYTKFY